MSIVDASVLCELITRLRYDHEGEFSLSSIEEFADDHFKSYDKMISIFLMSLHYEYKGEFSLSSIEEFATQLIYNWTNEMVSFIEIRQEEIL